MGLGFSSGSIFLAIPLILLASLVAAQTPEPQDRRRLVEQKIRLVEMLVATQAAKTSTGDSKSSTERLEKGKSALALARNALNGNRLDEASQVLDDALRTTSSQQQLPSAATLSADALRHTHQNLIEQVATYRASIEELIKQPKHRSEARKLIGNIDTKTAEAGRNAGSGDLAAANRQLSDAYQLAIAGLSRLRAGDEVVNSLNFATPAEEYAYEMRRFESNKILVGIMVSDGKAEGAQRNMVSDLEARGLQLRIEADGLARKGEHKEAVLRMEMAIGQLNRALQIMGVPVF